MNFKVLLLIVTIASCISCNRSTNSVAILNETATGSATTPMLYEMATGSATITKVETAPFLGKECSIYTTASETDLRLTKTGNATFKSVEQPRENEESIFVNPNRSFQTFLGIGGSITDASAEVFAKLPLDKQEELLTAYYDKENGIGYTLCRTPIHSCDFSSASFTYIEEGDETLSTFNIDHDRTYRIPLIKKATAAAGGQHL